LSTESAVEYLSALGGGAVVNVAVRLYNPYEFLNRVVEVKADLVGGRTNRFRASVLELLNEVLMRVLCHAAALISVEVDVIYVEGSGYKGLTVSGGSLEFAGALECGYSPEALINSAEVEVNLNFVVLESDERKSEARVGAEPELKRYVKSGLRKSVARSAYLARSIRVARSINISEGRISYESELSGVTNHLVVALFLVLVKGKLAPDVHPVTVVLLDALAANFYFYIFYKLVAREIKPASVGSHAGVDFRKSYLKVSAVSKVTVAAYSAGYTAAEISLSVESLFNGFHCEVSVATVSYLPEGNLRVASKIYVLSAISYELHKSTSHD
jgi:hypothetical protein